MARDQARMSATSDGRHGRGTGVTDSLTHSLNKHGAEWEGERVTCDDARAAAPPPRAATASPLAPLRIPAVTYCLDTTFRFLYAETFAYSETYANVYFR